MIKRFINNFWSILHIAICIILYVLAYNQFKLNDIETAFINFGFGTLFLFLHCYAAENTVVLDPLRIRIVSADVWFNNNGIWSTLYFIEQEEMTIIYYFGFKIKSDLGWPKSPDYKWRSDFGYTTKEAAMKEINNILIKLKKKNTIKEDVRDVKVVSTIVVEEELKKITV